MAEGVGFFLYTPFRLLGHLSAISGGIEHRLAKDALHPAVLAAMLVVHIQLDNLLGVQGRLDSQVFQVEEDRVVQQAGDYRRADTWDLPCLPACKSARLVSETTKDRFPRQ
jgi:hypothetical protein